MFCLQSVFTRMAVVKALEKIPDAKFLKYEAQLWTSRWLCCLRCDVVCFL